MAKPRRPPRPPAPAMPSRPTRPGRPPRPRRPALAAPANPGPSTLPTASLFVGVDRKKFPGDPPEFLRALALRSNVDWTAMYLQPAPSAGLGRRLPNGTFTNDGGWMTRVRQIRGEGFGVLPVWVGEQSPTVTQPKLSLHPSAANGTRDGSAAAHLLEQAGFEVGTVVYVDIERPGNAELIEREVFEYIEAFCRRIESLGFRAGLYTPFQTARALSRRWPMIAAWVVNTKWQVSPLRGNVPSPAVAVDPLQRRQVQVIVSRPEIAKSRKREKARPSEPDRDDNRLDFPLLWQYAIDLLEPIPVLPPPPPRARGEPQPIKWDFSASIMREPSFPACEPRLAAAAIGAKAMGLGSLAPPRDAGGNPAAPGRSGELWQTPAASLDPTRLPPEQGNGGRLHAWARPSVAPDPVKGFTVGVLLEDRTPAVIPVDTDGNRWTRAAPLPVSALPAMRQLSGVHVTKLGERLFLVGIAATGPNVGQVLITRRGPDGRWEELRPMGKSRAHPLSGLAMTSRSDDVIDVFAIGDDGRLRNFWWARWEAAWPGDNERTIGGSNVELQPQSPITAVASSRTLDVLAIGRDGRLYAASWRKEKDWTELFALGDSAFRPFPLAQPAAVVRGDEVSTDVFVVDSSGHLTTLWRPGGKRQWSGGDQRRIGGDKDFPHLLTDITALAPSPTSLEVNLVAHDGKPVRTQWSTTKDWTDFAPINLPAFASPEP